MIRSFFGTVPVTPPQKEPVLLIAVMILNLIIPVRLDGALVSGSTAMGIAFGPDTDARRVPTAI
ncbi:hypothetical protein [uncultured Tateyamaria sp.]|uniref:hypothetical protein n=1 Tax=Tateyamaria sp. 1078 TaxID=3417464 RepID=UPI002634D1C4|nr:hypothetical protein [uncultured Tateyamaria sp.]